MKSRTILTDAQQNEIRRRFFYPKPEEIALHIDTPDQICRDYGINRGRLGRLVGGPLKRMGAAIERVYS